MFRGGATRTLEQTRTLMDLATTWTILYEVVHASWSPTVDRASLLELFTPMLAEELDAEHTVLSLVDDELVAACFVFAGEDPVLEVVAEALLPGHPRARAAVGGGMARVLSMAQGRPVEFDGHLSDPHFFPVLQGLPDVQTGSTPLDLLELAG